MACGTMTTSQLIGAEHPNCMFSCFLFLSHFTSLTVILQIFRSPTRRRLLLLPVEARSPELRKISNLPKFCTRCEGDASEGL